MYFQFYLSIFLISVSSSFSEIIEELSRIEWICANEKCSEPISRAEPKAPYRGDHELKVGFKFHDKINIHGKPKTDGDYWLVSVDDKFGIAPSKILKETKVIKNKEDCIINKLDLSKLLRTSNAGKASPKAAIEPSPPTYEVIDGTKIPFHPDPDEDEVTVSSDDEVSVNVDNSTVVVNDTPDYIGSAILNPEEPDSEISLADEAPIYEDNKNKIVAHESEGKAQETLSERKSIESSQDEESEVVGFVPSPEMQPAVPSVSEASSITDASSTQSPMGETASAVTPPVSSSESEPEKPGGLEVGSESAQNENSLNGEDTSLSESVGNENANVSSEANETLTNEPSETNHTVSYSEPLESVPPTIGTPIMLDQLDDQKSSPETTYDSSVQSGAPAEETGHDSFTNASHTQYPSDVPGSSTDSSNISYGSTVSSYESTPPPAIYSPYDNLKYPSIGVTTENPDIAPSQDMLSPNVEEGGQNSNYTGISPDITTSNDNSEINDTITETVEHLSSPSIVESSSLDIEEKPPVQDPHYAYKEPSEVKPDYSKPPTDSSAESEEIHDDSDKGWFSSVSSMVDSLREMFSSSDIGVDDSNTIHEFVTEATFKSMSSAVKPDIEQSCEKDNLRSPPDNPAREELPFPIPGLDGVNMSGSTIIYLMITSSVVILFSLGYYYIENLKRDTELVAKINSLSAELFFAQKELLTIEEQMSTTSENFQKLASNTSTNEEEVLKLKSDLEENKAVKEGLELEIKRLEKEIEELVESNDEMHKMLTESITEDDRTQSLLANIADLKSVLSERLDEIATLTDQLDKDKQEVELLTIALQKTEEQKESLEEKLQVVLNDIDLKALAVSKEFEEKVTSLEKSIFLQLSSETMAIEKELAEKALKKAQGVGPGKALSDWLDAKEVIEEISLERTNFEKELCELKAESERLSAEKELAEKALKKAQGVGPGKALSDWLDAKEVRVELVTVQKEVDKLRRGLDEAKEHEAKLQKQKNELQQQIETLNNNYETAEKEKIEALTKLQVLSNYFKEKEIQLQVELGEKEAQWLQKQSEDHTIYEQMRSLREENLSYKAQNEALKKEILDQETSFKIQIANEEQKSQEHWINLRHIERRLKEAQMETAHLRSRLTALETNHDSLDEKHKSLELINGEVGMGPGSPPFMLYPPPPPDFIPPFPLISPPPLTSPSRPPPLGRLSSPPLTPPPPLAPYDLFPPPPGAPSPPSLRGVIKPQPKEPTTHRKQKESLSSNHSSESMDKPMRRGKR